MAHLQPLSVQLVDLQFRQSALAFFYSPFMSLFSQMHGDGSVDTHFKEGTPASSWSLQALSRFYRMCVCACDGVTGTLYMYVCDKCVRGMIGVW